MLAGKCPQASAKYPVYAPVHIINLATVAVKDIARDALAFKSIRSLRVSVVLDVKRTAYTTDATYGVVN